MCLSTLFHDRSICVAHMVGRRASSSSLIVHYSTALARARYFGDYPHVETAHPGAPFSHRKGCQERKEELLDRALRDLALSAPRCGQSPTRDYAPIRTWAKNPSTPTPSPPRMARGRRGISTRGLVGSEAAHQIREDNIRPLGTSLRVKEGSGNGYLPDLL